MNIIIPVFDSSQYHLLQHENDTTNLQYISIELSLLVYMCSRVIRLMAKVCD